MQTLVLFSHGKESGPWGSKIRVLADVARRHGAAVDSVDYSDLPSPEARVQRLHGWPLPPHDRLVLVGSSMGGYVSTLASAAFKPAGLFLLAPAFYVSGYAEQDPVPHATDTAIIHGWRDDIIPPEHSIRFASRHRCDLHLVDGDHRLNDVLQQVEALFDDFFKRL